MYEIELYVNSEHIGKYTTTLQAKSCVLIPMYYDNNIPLGVSRHSWGINLRRQQFKHWALVFRLINDSTKI